MTLMLINLSYCGIIPFQNGTLKIIDRRKHIFKLSQGEYIVPEKIENIYIRSQYVEQVFVHGESLKVKLDFQNTQHNYAYAYLDICAA